MTATQRPLRALVIPVEGPIYELDLDTDDSSSLAQLQTAVGGYIEALGLPDFIPGSATATAYINEDGKLEGLPFNGRATDLLVPGVGLFFGDYIAGVMVVCGFDPRSGRNRPVPEGVERRVRLIEQEAGA